jgi:predicted TIM-barrel fold metal-dependent hydrolase
MVRLFGAQRILFGSDSPWNDQCGEVEKIRALPLSEGEKTAILGGNAAELLGLSVP